MWTIARGLPEKRVCVNTSRVVYFSFEDMFGLFVVLGVGCGF